MALKKFLSEIKVLFSKSSKFNQLIGFGNTGIDQESLKIKGTKCCDAVSSYQKSEQANNKNNFSLLEITSLKRNITCRTKDKKKQVGTVFVWERELKVKP